ncbi:transglycosylase domain-containing protein [Halobacteriovorax sp. GB3]|uniref:transglycosylase domain-containing protein n=1 Tax=Halobacteriovorax sp. GB3 TaxID=2719615 RepID=UPI0023619409|nr:transglycosylase domain-containing protein [Halobacteriovorax sp. GB3]MDD0854770.1 transglycosylase domain-containing protein [Halobacteriovorax sp. GB3]
MGTSFLAFNIYVTKLIAEVDLTPFEKIRGKDNFKTAVSSFEAGSFVDREEFENYLLFSSDSRSMDILLDELKRERYLSEDKNSYLLEKDFEIEGLFRNDCEDLYCFQYYMSFANIPADMWKGLIGVEDNRFLTHKGIDLKSILRAIIIDIKEMKMVQGGSTITQQLVKNLYLTNEKKLSRKLKEIIISIYLEYKYEKEMILELYFNEIYWGSMYGLRMKGIYTASLFYFKKKPHTLNPYETAILVSMLKGPSYYNPVRHVNRLKQRANIVYEKLKEKSLTPIVKSFQWDDEQWSRWSESLKSETRAKILKSLWWTSTEKSDYDEYDRYILKHKAIKRLGEIKYENVAFKGVIKNLQTQKQYGFYSKYERDKEKALTSEPHQIGSTIKPIVYGIFQDFGKKWSDSVDTGPIELKLISGTWSPREASKKEIESATLKTALLMSLNRPLIRVANEIGFDKIEPFLAEYFENLQKPLAEYPAQLLGAIEIPISSYLDIYEKFIRKSCKTYKENSVIDVLSDPTITTIRRVVGKSLKDMRFFGKTGTTNQGYDNWYVSFDGVNLGLFWVGYEGKRDGDELKLYGSTTAFKVFNDFSRDKGKRFNELNCEIFND